MTRQQVLDLYFLDARHKLIDLAAFLDRLDRAEGGADFRRDAFQAALRELANEAPVSGPPGEKTSRAARVLLAFSDPTTEPIPAATVKAACGAWPGTGAPASGPAGGSQTAA